MSGRVVRVWKGYGNRAGVERYHREHFAKTVLPQLRTIDGFVEAKVLTRDSGSETEVVVVTLWESLDSVKAFAGDHYVRAVVEPLVRQVLDHYDEHVKHFVIAFDSSS